HQVNQVRRFRSVTLLEEVKRVLGARKRKRAKDSEVEGMHREIFFRTSLFKMTSVTGGELEFVHLSFQEYLAACRLARVGDPRFVFSILDDPWWKNALLF